MSRTRRALGLRGEQLVADRLAAQGWILLARNWRCSAGEIDIVAQDGECLVIVEVRTRRGDRFGRPERSIDALKRSRLAKLAVRYCYEHRWDGPCRVDVITVLLDSRGRVRRVGHYRNAVSGEWA